MKIKKASFVMSNTDYRKCPTPNLPEYAFIGRSNVGKSSLINALTNKKGLAMTSSTPGKTQLINHFLINENWYLVDLPGYGFARVSKTEKENFQKIIYSYLEKRENLLCTFVLVDIRHAPQKIDLEFMQWLGEHGVPFSIIFTKADKLKKGADDKAVETYKEEFLKTWEEMPPYFVTSSSKKEGLEDLLSFIHEINQEFRQS
ncbi:ribosome biogenesis GTP-binding protein YihA/YsxC [Algivirga pacifica]|uniref:Probable GTP-binding protein EngB n=1 Tax=Algivirga pacifica TaxID=1162670 RepID=A0ABP9DG87_9BACT